MYLHSEPRRILFHLFYRKRPYMFKSIELIYTYNKRILKNLCSFIEKLGCSIQRIKLMTLSQIIHPLAVLSMYSFNFLVIMV